MRRKEIVKDTKKGKLRWSTVKDDRKKTSGQKKLVFKVKKDRKGKESSKKERKKKIKQSVSVGFQGLDLGKGETKSDKEGGLNENTDIQVKEDKDVKAVSFDLNEIEFENSGIKKKADENVTDEAIPNMKQMTIGFDGIELEKEMGEKEGIAMKETEVEDDILEELIRVSLYDNDLDQGTKLKKKKKLGKKKRKRKKKNMNIEITKL